MRIEPVNEISHPIKDGKFAFSSKRNNYVAFIYSDSNVIENVYYYTKLDN